MARDRFKGMGDTIPTKSSRDIVSQFRDILRDFRETANELSKNDHEDGQEKVRADIWE